MSSSSRFPSRRSFLASAGGAALAAGAGPAIAAPIVVPRAIGKMDPLGRFGSNLNRAEFENAPRALKPELVASLALSHANMRGVVIAQKPARHVLSNLPPVSQQGTAASLGYPGSCEAQSFGYALGTYTAANGMFTHFDPTPAANRASAAWLFAWLTNQEGRTGCGGSMALDYLSLLVSNGAPSEAQVPYKPDCSYLSARSGSNPNGIDVNLGDYSGIGRFQIGSVNALPNFQGGLATFLPVFKSYLLAGHAIAFSGVVANGYDQPSKAMVNGAFDPQGFIANSGHGQVVVGFDDSLGHTGAFLIQNSFGTDWPYLPGATALTAGRLWWTYEAFFASQGYGAIAYPIQPKVRIPQYVTLVPTLQGDPEASIVEAARSLDSGNGYLLFQHEFAQPVRLLSVTVKPPGAAPAVTQRYNGTISHGYSHVTQRGAFAPGTYQVTLHAETIATRSAPAHPVTYTGSVQIK